MRGTGSWVALVVGIPLFLGILPSTAAAEEFSPIPVIKGMELLKTGSEAPTFVVKDLEGKTFDFAQEIGKRAHMMVFWSLFCEPCREEMPLIERIHNQYKDKGLTVLSVNLDGGPFADGVKGYINQGKYTFRVLMDELDNEMFKIADPYNVAGTPVIYFINKKGVVAFNVLGRVADEELTSKIDEALAAQ